MEIRTEELERLEIFYHSRNKKTAIIYGRLGMGKTTLLRKFSDGKQTLWYTACPCTNDIELQLLADAFHLHLDQPALEDVLAALTESLQTVPAEHPLLLVLESYPDFARAGSENHRILHHYVTEVWRDLPVKLVISSDTFLDLHKLFFSAEALWKKEDCMILHLDPLCFRDAVKFIPEGNADEKIFLYGITGGIPALLSLVQNRTPEDAMRQIFFSCWRTPCHPENVLRQELRELPYYTRILMALASGKQRVNELSEEVGKPKDIVVPYLKTLLTLDLAKKENPVTEKTNHRKTRYDIRNTADLFWYRYLAPVYNNVIESQYEAIWEHIVVPDREYYLKKVFCQIAGEYLLRKSDIGQLPFRMNEIGNWWENGEGRASGKGFDLVGVGTCSGETCTVFCRVYYGEDLVEVSEIKELIALSKSVQREGSIFYIVFSGAGFHENALTVAAAIRNIILISRDDVIKDAAAE